MRELEHIKNIEYSVKFCYNFNHSQVASTLCVSDCEIKKTTHRVYYFNKQSLSWTNFLFKMTQEGPGNVMLPGPFCVFKRVVGQISISLF